MHSSDRGRNARMPKDVKKRKDKKNHDLFTAVGLPRILSRSHPPSIGRSIAKWPISHPHRG